MKLYKRLVNHECIGPQDLILYVVDILEKNIEDPGKTLYKCRYFFEGEFKSGEFYEFELKAIDNSSTAR